MATMATTLSFSVYTKPKTTFLENSQSSFHGLSVPSPYRIQSIKSTPQDFSISLSASTTPPPYDLRSFTFEPIKESIVSREMTRRCMMDMITYADTDVDIVGAGSAGLSCAYELSKNPSVQVAIIEQSVSPGGGAWLGEGKHHSCQCTQASDHLSKRIAMEAENSLGNFNRTRSTRSRAPVKKLSDTPYKESDKKPLSSGRDYKDRYGDHGCCSHGTSKEELEVFDEYLKQVRDSEGYEVRYVLAGCMSVRYIPCDLDREREFLNEASRKCIAKYNKKHRKAPNYEFVDVVMATKQLVAGYNYYITFRARQVGLPDDMVKTFRAAYYYCKFNGINGQVTKVVKRG